MHFSPSDYPNAELTHQIIGSFFDVYNELGTGMREVVYQRALAVALQDKKLKVDREVCARVAFRGRPVGRFWPDLVVEQKVVVELKVAPAIEPAHCVQLLNALWATMLEVGLLLNFGPKPQVKRLIATQPGNNAKR